MRKKLSTSTKIKIEKPEDDIGIADKKIDEKSSNPVGIEKKNCS